MDPLAKLMEPSRRLMRAIEPVSKLILDRIFFTIIIIFDPKENEIG
jgi:hypothetical protein